jgi:hypothetical protein
VISKKITDSAKGEECTLRIPGICNRDPSTTVFAHMNGGGMAYKHHDIHGCYACSDCHQWVDGGYVKSRYCGTERDVKNMAVAEFNRAMIETQIKLLEKGLIKIC